MFICVLINLRIFLECLFWAKVLVTESEALVGSDGDKVRRYRVSLCHVTGARAGQPLFRGVEARSL